MRKLKRGIMAFLVGEFLTLWHRDKSFQKKVKKEKDIAEKLKIIFHEMVDFNKELVEEAQKIDIKEHTQQAKQFVEKELNQLKDKLSDLDKKWKDLNEKKIQPILAELELQYHQCTLKAKEFGKEVTDKLAIEEKIEDIKAHLDTLKKRKA